MKASNSHLFNEKKRVLVTGGAGLLGVNVASIMKDKWDIHLFYRSKPVSIDGTSTYRIDLINYDETLALIREINPDIIIHSAAFKHERNSESI